MRIGYCVLAALLLVSAAPAATPGFQGIGDLPGGGFSSSIWDLSNDGSAVVGSGNSASGIEAIRWTAAGGIEGLGDFAGGTFSSEAYGVSNSGAVVTGVGEAASSSEAFRYSGSGPMQGLGTAPSVGRAVSDDGSVIVGSGNVTPGSAFRWTSTSGMQSLGQLPGGSFNSAAFGISGDGAVIVGQTRTFADGFQAFRWTAADGMQSLGDLAGGGFESLAFSANADGSAVVGYGYSASGREAFRWTSAAGAMQPLGDLAGGTFDSYAYDVSGDGSIAVGFSRATSGDRAFIWDSANGMRNLKDVLVNDYGFDLTGWTLRAALGISADGFTIAGDGFNPSGQTEAWVTTIPEPCSLFLVLVGGVLTRRRSRRAQGIPMTWFQGTGSFSARAA